MSQSSLWDRWIGGCRTTGHYGCSSGDSVHLGMEYYTEPFPCPNGSTWTGGDPLQLPCHLERIAKAKADIEEHRRYIEGQEQRRLADEVFSSDDVRGLIDLTKEILGG